MQIAIELKLCRIISYTSISYTSSHSFTESRVSHPDPEYSDRSRVIHQTNQTFAYRSSTSPRKKTQESKMLSRRVIIALITSDRSFGDRGLDRMTFKTKSSSRRTMPGTRQKCNYDCRVAARADCYYGQRKCILSLLSFLPFSSRRRERRALDSARDIPREKFLSRFYSRLIVTIIIILNQMRLFPKITLYPRDPDYSRPVTRLLSNRVGRGSKNSHDVPASIRSAIYRGRFMGARVPVKHDDGT